MKAFINRLVIVVVLCSMGACRRSAKEDATSQQSATTDKDGSKSSEEKRGLIKAPPEAVVSFDELKAKHGWNGDKSINKLVENAYMVRFRTETGAVWSIEGLAMGNLAIEGKMFLDDTSFHLVEGEAYITDKAPLPEKKTDAPE